MASSERVAFKKDFLNCPLCSKYFEGPRCFQECWHSVCLECILDLEKKSPQSTQKTTCPICFTEVNKPLKGLKKLTKNVMLKSLLEDLKEEFPEKLEISRDFPYEKSCLNHKKNFEKFCKACGLFVCPDCCEKCADPEDCWIPINKLEGFLISLRTDCENKISYINKKIEENVHGELSLELGPLPLRYRYT